MAKIQTHEFRMVAKTIFGLEEILAGELLMLGAKNVKEHNRAVNHYIRGLPRAGTAP